MAQPSNNLIRRSTQHWLTLVIAILLMSGPSLEAKPNWRKIKRIIKIAAADCKYGLDGYKIGALLGPVGCIAGATILGAGGSIYVALDSKTGLSRPLPTSLPIVPNNMANPFDSVGATHNRIVWDYLMTGVKSFDALDFARFIEKNAGKYALTTEVISVSDLERIDSPPSFDDESADEVIDYILGDMSSSPDRDSLARLMTYLLQTYIHFGLRDFESEYSFQTSRFLHDKPDSTQRLAGSILSIMRHSIWFNSERMNVTGPVVAVRRGKGVNCDSSEYGICEIQAPVIRRASDGSSMSYPKKYKRHIVGTQSETIYDEAVWRDELFQTTKDFVLANTSLTDDTLTLHMLFSHRESENAVVIDSDIVLEYDITYELANFNKVIPRGTYQVDWSSDDDSLLGSISIPLRLIDNPLFGKPGIYYKGIPCFGGQGLCETSPSPWDPLSMNRSVPFLINKVDSNVRIIFLDEFAFDADSFNFGDGLRINAALAAAMGTTAAIRVKGPPFSYPVDYPRRFRYGMLQFVPDVAAVSVSTDEEVLPCISTSVEYYDFIGALVRTSELNSGRLYLVVQRCSNGQITFSKHVEP